MDVYIGKGISSKLNCILGGYVVNSYHTNQEIIVYLHPCLVPYSSKQSVLSHAKKKKIQHSIVNTNKEQRHDFRTTIMQPYPCCIIQTISDEWKKISAQLLYMYLNHVHITKEKHAIF